MVPDGWQTRELGEIVDIRSGGTPSKSRHDFWGGEFPWVSAKDLKTHRIIDAEDKLTVVGFENANKANPDDILILVRGMTLLKDVPVGIVMRGLAFNQDIKALRTKRGLDPKFAAYALVAKKAHLMRLVDRANHGTGRLDTALLSSFPIEVPPLQEQKKIAEILSTWDDAIEMTENLLTNSQALKRSLMHQLLTGKQRLKDFKDSPWQEAYMGDLFIERNERGGVDLPLLSITGSRGVIRQDEADRRDISREDKSAYKRIAVDDIGYNTMRMWQGVSAQSQLEGLVSPAYTVLRAKPQIDSGYAAFLFKLPKQVHLFRRFSQGLTSDQWNLKFKHFREVPTSLSSNKLEQKAIAACISEASALCAAYSRDIAKLRAEKQAMMQQLLTGKRRVTP